MNFWDIAKSSVEQLSTFRMSFIGGFTAVRNMNYIAQCYAI